jgi:hypothetical protein
MIVRNTPVPHASYGVFKPLLKEREKLTSLSRKQFEAIAKIPTRTRSTPPFFRVGNTTPKKATKGATAPVWHEGIRPSPFSRQILTLANLRPRGTFGELQCLKKRPYSPAILTQFLKVCRDF